VSPRSLVLSLTHADGPALQSFFKALLDAAGVRDESVRHDLAGA